MHRETVELNHRERAALRAIAQGTAEMTCSCEPDLFIDGLACCDQFTVRKLAHLDYFAPARPGLPGDRVRAVITARGRAALGQLAASRSAA